MWDASPHACPLTRPDQVASSVQWREAVMASCSLETLQAIRLKVVEASPDAKIVINRLREVIDCNEEAEFLFGYARGDIIGKPIEQLMPEDSRESHSKHVTNFFKSPR